MRRGLWPVVAVAALAGLGAGAGLRHWLAEPAQPAASRPAATAALPDPDVEGERRPAFALPDLEGRERSIAEFAGDVVLVNFWATWCPPCLEEVPALDRLQDGLGERGLQVIGVALESAAPVRRFAHRHDVGYPLLVGARAAFELAARYGNPRGTLPYTVVIDRDGVVRATHHGALTRAEARALVMPYL